jgi:hypothetical protein
MSFPFSIYDNPFGLLYITPTTYFIFRLTDSTAYEDAGIEPATPTEFAVIVELALSHATYISPKSSVGDPDPQVFWLQGSGSGSIS